ncbi:hypothetical protein F5B19DRAFT_440027 [Rostrohypoxylon terebratum]|nr:hypothetical protein F5B19DRAFT_440027 [Rostrohypoxylon terebratum]
MSTIHRIRPFNWPSCANMNVFSNIWKDGRLLNATVYAQWLCVISAVSFIAIRICWLITADYPARYPEKWGILVMVGDMIFFPLVSLTVELSHIIRPRFPAYIGIIYCLVRMFTSFITNIVDAARTSSTDPSGPFIFLGVARMLACYYFLTLPYIPCRKTAFNPEERAVPNMESLPVRTCFHLAYVLVLPYAARPLPFAPRLFQYAVPRPWTLHALARYGFPAYYEPAVLFSALASLAYWMALALGQEYVFSRTLGGPGVERLTFVRPGRVQTVDSIGLEEGRIRLP